MVRSALVFTGAAALHRIQFSILHIFKILDSGETELYQAMWSASVSYPYGIVSTVAVFIWRPGGANIVRFVYTKRVRIACSRPVKDHSRDIANR